MKLRTVEYRMILFITPITCFSTPFFIKRSIRIIKLPPILKISVNLFKTTSKIIVREIGYTAKRLTNNRIINFLTSI
jgi:hypothetical protein